LSSGIGEIPVSHLSEMEKMLESHFDQTKPSHKSLSIGKWFYASLAMVFLKNSKRKMAGLPLTSKDQ
jgi:hypothetical protein